jgi:hypothetical protein
MFKSNANFEHNHHILTSNAESKRGQTWVNMHHPLPRALRTDPPTPPPPPPPWCIAAR